MADEGSAARIAHGAARPARAAKEGITRSWQSGKRKRRALLHVALAATVGAGAGRVLGAQKAAAAATAILTESDNIATSQTSLRATIPGTTLFVQNNGPTGPNRNALYAHVGTGSAAAFAVGGRAIVGVSELDISGAAGVYGKATGSGDARGVFGEADSGTGVYARSTNGTALHVEGTSRLTGTATFDGSIKARMVESDDASLTAVAATSVTADTVRASTIDTETLRADARGPFGIVGQSPFGVGVAGAAGGRAGRDAPQGSDDLHIGGFQFLGAGVLGVASAARGGIPSLETGVVGVGPRIGAAGIAGEFRLGDLFQTLTARAGVAGLSTGQRGTGVYGEGEGKGVWGQGSGPGAIGLHGVANAAGAVAVRAESAAGTALQVAGTSTHTGPATFDSSVLANSVSAAEMHAARFAGVGGQAAAFTGNGSGLTGLDASNIIAGTVADARLPANVPLRNADSNTFTGTISAGAVTAGTFAGTGAGGAPVFAAAGTAVVRAGTSRVRVVSPAVTIGANVLLTLQSSAGRRAGLSHVEKAAGRFDIVLSGRASQDTPVAYFVLRSAV